MEQRIIAQWSLRDGYSSSRPVLDGGDFCQFGSENILFGLNDRPRSFRGMTYPVPLVALAGVGAGNVDIGDHRVLVTFVTANAEIRAAENSGIVSVTNKVANGRVAITNIPIGPTGVTSRKVYMTTAGGSVYFLLSNGTIADNVTTTLTANDSDLTLGNGAVSPIVGGRILFNFDQTFAALVDDGSIAKGSVWMISSGKTLAAIGSGDVYLSGSSISFNADPAPQLRLLRSGVYTGTGTGPYFFGLTTPSAPEFALGVYGSGLQVTGQSTLTGKLKGTYSVAITKIRSTTGAESNGSVTSSIITAPASGGWGRITFPLIETVPGTTGADRWGVYVTQSGFGAIGPQLFYIEILESDITATRNITGNLAATSPMLTATSGTLTVADIGRQVAATGGSGADYTGYITSILSSTTADLAVAPVASTGATIAVTQAVDGIPRSVPLEWIDADLVGGELIPINNDAPQAGWFGFSIQDVTAIVGSYGDQTAGVTGSPGNAIQVSRPGFPEAYPADTHLFLPETPTAVLDRAADNYVFIFGLNSLCGCTYTGGPIPLDLQLIWNNTGIARAHNAVIADGRLYAFTGTGLVRMGDNGQPDREFAADVMADLEGLIQANVVLAYDTNTRHVIVASDSREWCFNQITGHWSTRLNLATLVTPVAGNVTAAVTIGGSAKISMLNGSTFSLYTWDSGSGSTWKIYTSWQDGGTANSKTIETVRGAFMQDSAATSISMAIYATDRRGVFDLTSARRSWTQYVPSVGSIMLRPKKINILGARAVVGYMSGTSSGANSAPIEIIAEGTMSKMRV